MLQLQKLLSSGTVVLDGNVGTQVLGCLYGFAKVLSAQWLSQLVHLVYGNLTSASEDVLKHYLVQVYH